jgi:hypothetical protein
LNPLSPVEAMELLSDKLGKTRNNQEFLHNMSSLYVCFLRNRDFCGVEKARPVLGRAFCCFWGKFADCSTWNNCYQ